MLETVREYALELLEASGEVEAVRRQHALYVVALAEAADRELLGPNQVTWLATLDREHDNIRAALAWSLAAPDGPGSGPAASNQPGRVELGARLAGALLWFWYIRCHLTEGRRWAEPTLARSAGLPGLIRARMMMALGGMMDAQGDHAEAAVICDQATVLYREAGDRWGVAFSMGARGLQALKTAQYERATAQFSESLSLFREIDDGWGIAWNLGNLARVATASNDLPRGRALMEESLALKRTSGDLWGMVLSLPYAGLLAVAQNDQGRAVELFDETISLAHQLGYPRAAAVAFDGLGRVEQTRGNYARASTLYAQSLHVNWELGVKAGVAEGLEHLAMAGMLSGLRERSEPAARALLVRATRLRGAAESLRLAIQAPVPAADRAGLDRQLALVRSKLGDAAFSSARLAGATLPLAQAIEQALAPLSTPSTSVTTTSVNRPAERASASSSSSDQASILTPREREVAALIAQGASNPEIGAALVVSRRTVEAHVTSILGKLALTSRAQIAVWAVQHGLGPT